MASRQTTFLCRFPFCFLLARRILVLEGQEGNPRLFCRVSFCLWRAVLAVPDGVCHWGAGIVLTQTLFLLVCSLAGHRMVGLGWDGLGWMGLNVGFRESISRVGGMMAMPSMGGWCVCFGVLMFCLFCCLSVGGYTCTPTWGWAGWFALIPRVRYPPFLVMLATLGLFCLWAFYEGSFERPSDDHLEVACLFFVCLPGLRVCLLVAVLS